MAQLRWQFYYIAFKLADGLARFFGHALMYCSGWAVDLEIMFSEAWAEYHAR